MAGRKDVVETQSRRSGFGNLVAKHAMVSVYLAPLSTRFIFGVYQPYI